MSYLQNKVVWLTGASSGIGEAFALRAAKSGCKLALTARNKEALIKLANKIRSEGGAAEVFAGDVTDKGAMQEIDENISSSLGAVDVLVANAGTHIPTDVERFNTEEYQNIFELNLFGTLNCIEAVLPSMIERRSGHIAAVSSVAGYRGLPKAAAYGASKAALTHFIESLRFDLLKYKIAATVINPGFVKTPLTDKNDFEMPFLVSAEQAALYMVRGLERGDKEIHFPKRFSWIMKTLRVIPYGLYHWFIAKKVAS